MVKVKAIRHRKTKKILPKLYTISEDFLNKSKDKSNYLKNK